MLTHPVPVHPNCTTCKKAMRPKLRTLEEFPNTEMIGAHGKCQPCYNADYRAKKNTAAEDQLPHTMAGLSGFLHQRRQRLARQNRKAGTRA